MRLGIALQERGDDVLLSLFMITGGVGMIKRQFWADNGDNVGGNGRLCTSYHLQKFHY